MVGYIKDLKNGLNKVVTRTKHKKMLMEVSVLKLREGDKNSFYFPSDELAVLLLTGKIEIIWENKRKMISRASLFKNDPWCLHVSKKTKVELVALKDSEVLIQTTNNLNTFPAKLYSPKDCRTDVFGDGVWNNTARRKVRTIFDYGNAPYSNMVMGELINYPGRWSSYVPHHHPQPEVYFYKFDKPQGFGVSIIGDRAYMIRNNSFAAIEGGLTHPQVTAPGYPMYYCWMIRHFDNAPWKDRIMAEEHKWLLKKNPKIWED